ncbi:RNA-directed DNA polymerase, eukaryota [Tanacetum coccineum]
MDVEKIATSFFVTNFPESLDAKSLWKEFQLYGRIADAFIANKHSKIWKRFGFVRFLGIRNGDNFVRTLSNIWIGSFHVYVSIAKFQRHEKSTPFFEPKGKADPGLKPHEVHVRPSNYGDSSKQSYASVANGVVASKGGLNIGIQKTSRSIQLSEHDLIKVEDMTTVVLVKVKEVDTISNMYCICRNEGFNDIKIHYVGGLWV